MSDQDPPHPDENADASELRGLDAGELLARGLNTVKPSGGALHWQPPTPEEAALLLPQYQIESLLGAGGMGAVYKGIQPALERPVAIKLLPAEIAADEQFITRFQREARTLAKLQHPGIVVVYDYGQTSEGHLYFVMEYVDGTDLRRILRGPGLDPEQALVVIARVCDALHAAHVQGVIHRDIKPENILITKDGYVKLADFGLARPLIEDDTGRLTGSHMVMGTLDYMAPEQREGHGDHRADIFALGVMLYEMLTGKPPRGVFEMPSQKVQVDARIDQVVVRALQSEPDRRYQQATEMKTDVDYIRKTPVPAVPAAVHSKIPRTAATKRKERKALAYAAGIAVLLFGCAGYLIWRKTVQQNRPSADAELSVSPGASITATKDTPFVNTLGMKFVPVPIGGEGNSGRKELFSVWDTRMQDYEEYALTNKVDVGWNKWQKGGLPISPGPEYPVVGVSWQDARAFCKWLTGKEASEGKMPKGMTYRLPTDEEWSAAVGLPKEEGATPKERSKENGLYFPWGTGFPPPRANVGNYGDIAKHEKFPNDPWLKDYSDGYAVTSPVGSFAPNRYGLYDMGGNVFQLCEDLLDSAGTRRVIRGGAWYVTDVGSMKSSYRGALEPDFRGNGVGFRCVLSNETPALTANETIAQSAPAVSGGKSRSNTAGEDGPPGGLQTSAVNPHPSSKEGTPFPADPKGAVQPNPLSTPSAPVAGVATPISTSPLPSTAPILAFRSVTGVSTPGTPMPNPPRETSPQPPPSGKLDELREHTSAMRESVLGPLDQATSVSIETYMTDLREDIKDEMARKPTASPAAYAYAVQLCNSLIAVQGERDGLIARLNNNMPTGAAGSPITTKVHPNWKDIEREHDEAARVTHNNTLETTFHKQIKLQWGLRTTELRRTLDAEVSQFRMALRQSPLPR